MTNHEASTLGWRQLEQGRPAEARALFEQVLTRDANHAAALHGAGYVAWIEGRRQQAGDLLARAIRADPKRADAHFHLAGLCLDEGQRDAAMTALRRAIALDPKRSRYHAALGSMLADAGAMPQALAAYERAVELDPADAIALVNLAHVLLRSDRLDDAEAAARRAIDAQPTLTNAHVTLGSIFEQQDRMAEAEAAIRRALTINANDAEAHKALALLLLRRGDLAGGWEEYEWRFAAASGRVKVAATNTPRWNGSPLNGRTLLVQAEQGAGDAIQFVRFALMAAERSGGRVLLRCDPTLVDVLQTLDGGVEVIADTAPPPPHDLHLPLLSLPRALRIEILDAVAMRAPYLHADPARVAAWSAKLPPASSAGRVGIAWAGNPQHVDDRNRSIDAALLAPLADVEGVTWISLQKDRRGNPPMRLVDLTPQIRDFADTAAIVAQLDLIISVDTAVAHLAGALAKPVWLLLPRQADWRWMTGRSDSPWYPSMRLFRQPRRGDWQSVIGEVIFALRELGAVGGMV